MNIRIIRNTIPEAELRGLAAESFGHMIKGVVDLGREIVAFGGEFHVDANNVLISDGSSQEDLWGFNWYFDVPQEERIEYTSLINIRPHQGNRRMEVVDESLRKRMRDIIERRVV